jgi:hypothetical protein
VEDRYTRGAGGACEARAVADEVDGAPLQFVEET